MTDLISQHHLEIIQQFISSWPIERLQTMTLEEYNSRQNKDSFCYWLEKKTEHLGSVWGGSGLKFGIFEFDYNHPDAEQKSDGSLKIPKYKWCKKYGSNAHEAFEKIKSIIVSIAMAASAGDFGAIDNIDWEHMVKWKIAYLYQKPEESIIICEFNRDKLLKCAKCDDKTTPTSELYKKIYNNRIKKRYK